MQEGKLPYHIYDIKHLLFNPDISLTSTLPMHKKYIKKYLSTINPL